MSLLTLSRLSIFHRAYTECLAWVLTQRRRRLSHLLREKATHRVVTPVYEPIRIEVVLHLHLLLLFVFDLLMELVDL